MASLSRTILRTVPIAAATILAAATMGHDNDPKKKTLPPIYGEIVYGNQDGLAGGWSGDTEGFIFCSQIPVAEDVAKCRRDVVPCHNLS